MNRLGISLLTGWLAFLGCGRPEPAVLPSDATGVVEEDGTSRLHHRAAPDPRPAGHADTDGCARTNENAAPPRTRRAACG